MEADGNDEIRVVIYGCRGSIPVNGPEFDEFGGSTSCILITSDDSVSVGIIDARHRNKAPRSGDYEGRAVFGRKEQKA
jgi:hypothetical protein